MRNKKNEMKWKCGDLKCVQKPTRGRLSLATNEHEEKETELEKEVEEEEEEEEEEEQDATVVKFTTSP